MQETLVGTWVEKFPWRRDRLPNPGKGRGYPLQYSWASPGGSDGKEFACNAGDLGSIPGLGRSPGEGNSYPHQYSCMENPLGQRSLAVYSICSRRVRQDWATKHSTCANWKLGILCWLPVWTAPVFQFPLRELRALERQAGRIIAPGVLAGPLFGCPLLLSFCHYRYSTWK